MDVSAKVGAIPSHQIGTSREGGRESTPFGGGRKSAVHETENGRSWISRLPPRRTGRPVNGIEPNS